MKPPAAALGSFFVGSSTLVITDSRIYANVGNFVPHVMPFMQFASSGGGIHVEPPASSSGGIHVDDQEPPGEPRLFITNCDIFENIANTGGSIKVLALFYIEIDSSRIRNNSARSSCSVVTQAEVDSSDGLGGAATYGVVFGELYCLGGEGGAFHSSGFDGGSDSLFTISNSNVTGNFAGNEGGGLYTSFGQITLTTTLVSGNTAPIGQRAADGWSAVLQAAAATRVGLLRVEPKSGICPIPMTLSPAAHPLACTQTLAAQLKLHRQSWRLWEAFL